MPEKLAEPAVAASGLVVTVKVPAAATLQAESVYAASVMELVAEETRLLEASCTCKMG